MYCSNDFSFVICAYKDNPYLPQLIESLLNQTVKVNILMVSSTPSVFIFSNAKKYHIPVFVNHGKSGIAQDWNFGYSKAETQLVAIAHQDDYYCPEFAEWVIAAANENEDALILFTDYFEIRKDARVYRNRNLTVKRLMNLSLRLGLRYMDVYRNLVLRFGNPICCPAVTFVKDKCGRQPFVTGLRNSCDYKTWIKLSRLGRFVYIPDALMGHRIYKESTTSEMLQSHMRQNEDLNIFREFWPEPVARLIYKLYSLSEKSNELK